MSKSAYRLFGATTVQVSLAIRHRYGVGCILMEYGFQTRGFIAAIPVKLHDVKPQNRNSQLGNEDLQRSRKTAQGMPVRLRQDLYQRAIVI